MAGPPTFLIRGGHGPFFKVLAFLKNFFMARNQLSESAHSCWIYVIIIIDYTLTITDVDNMKTRRETANPGCRVVIL